MRINKILMIVCLMLVFSMTKEIYAAGLIDSVMGEASGFMDKGDLIGNSIVTGLVSAGIVDAIVAVGHLVFGIVTVILGAKYVWSGVEGKSRVKETLPTFVVAVVFFYLANTLYGFFARSVNSLIGTGSFSGVSGTIFGTISVFVNVASISAIIFLGIKYIWSPPDKKADIKSNFVPLVLGLIFVYCSVQVLNFIVNASAGLL